MSYSFPSGVKPFAHQLATFDFIINTPKCFVFNDIGTGKTLSTAWAMHYLMEKEEVQNVLIVAPVSTLNVVWYRTLFRVDPTLDIATLRGTADNKRSVLAPNRGIRRSVRIINPDSLHLLADHPSLKDFQMIIVDESAMFRNQKSRRAKALRTVCEKMKRIIMMTGSPMPEAPTDVWLTARIVCPHRVPRYFGTLRDLTMNKINMFKWAAKKDADTTIGKMLEGFVIRFHRDECLDLPPTQVVTHEVELSKEGATLIKQLRDEAAAEVEAGVITAGNEAVVINKMLQVVSGAVKASKEGHNNALQIVDVDAKFQALSELLDASSQPVIVYANFVGALARIAVWLRDKGISYRLVVGDTSGSDRVAAFDAVQSGEVKVLLAHPRAMAHGITLTTANIIVWWTPLFSHEIYEQATGRIIRAGQTRKTYVIHLASSVLERQVIKRLEQKQKLQGLLLDYLASGEN